MRIFFVRGNSENVLTKLFGECIINVGCHTFCPPLFGGIDKKANAGGLYDSI